MFLLINRTIHDMSMLSDFGTLNWFVSYRQFILPIKLGAKIAEVFWLPVYEVTLPQTSLHLPLLPLYPLSTLTLPYEFYFIYYVNISLLCKRASLWRNLQKITTRRKTKAFLVLVVGLLRETTVCVTIRTFWDASICYFHPM